jgi:hypothetical protein
LPIVFWIIPAASQDVRNLIAEVSLPPVRGVFTKSCPPETATFGRLR